MLLSYGYAIVRLSDLKIMWQTFDLRQVMQQHTQKYSQTDKDHNALYGIIKLERLG